MNWIREILPSISKAFLGLIFLMLANNIFFYHEHDLDTGETVRHAHPFFSQEEEQDRDHTENELILLDLVTHAQYFLPDRVSFLQQGISVAGYLHSSYIFAAPDSEGRGVLSLRGPPACFL
ncbi:hypothetical protein ADIS_1011 [Lunatimonas lonarensis]|uniref:Uncharacterized protein n=1 Tax=Lunatimonas lonarensis TaxID=1232681 RepID=R7ZWI3_9BACT|nr:hypothetical protein [Lunatimonas lonarensis]EON78496.1 hypothetical protein ADIS_1011 [Lunatimonas lonarensis]